MTIQAQHSGICPECGERWQPGDSLRSADSELPYEQRRRPTIWRHVACPESADDTGLQDTRQVMLTLVFRPWNGDLP